jgi:cytochrome c oxidase assembly protein subunit 15
VRLTNSGLGCTDWPRCTRTDLVPASGLHPWIEFGNRLVTGAVSAVVILAVLGSLRRVGRRRRDLVWLSLGLVGGVLGQIVLGGLTVLFDLAPPFVMGHFLLSMALVWCAVALHHRAGLPDGDAPAPTVSREDARMTRLLVVAAALVLFLGTVVTSSGPHGGDARAARLNLTVHDAARVHGIAVMLFLAMTVVTLASLARSGVAPAVLRRAEVLLVVLVAQAAVGYVQYFTRLPALLVGVHVAGATAVWIGVLRLDLAAVAAPSPAPVPVAVRASAELGHADGTH